LDINDKGQAVGWSYTAGNVARHAFLYSDGTLIDLGTLGGSNSGAGAINEKGQVIGWSDTAGNVGRHAFLYSDGTMTDLSLGGSFSEASSINDKGQVLGWSDTVGDLARHAFLYSNGTMTDLTQVVYDLFFVENFRGSGISADQIIGGCDRDGNRHACILTVPKK
jgi:probable HAF family extracellular repeat protein